MAFSWAMGPGLLLKANYDKIKHHFINNYSNVISKFPKFSRFLANLIKRHIEGMCLEDIFSHGMKAKNHRKKINHGKLQAYVPK